jgi:multidrug resistance efflux pump
MLTSSPYRRLALAIGLVVVWAVSPVVGQKGGEAGQKPRAAQDAAQAQGGEEQQERPEEEAAKPADEPKKEGDEQQQEKKDEVEFQGYVTATEESSIVLEPKEWQEFVVKSAVGHGTDVKPGDVLIQFDPTKFDQTVVDVEHEIALGKLSIAQAEEKLDLQRKSTRLSIAAAERAERRATEDLKRFLTTGRDRQKEALDFALRNAENYLAYEEEELKQLTKMYEADDLTEETEEIIMRRTKDSVENARFQLDRTRHRHEDGTEVELPREEESLEESLKQSALALETARATLPPQVNQAEIELEKLRLKQQRIVERLNRLREDRQWLTVKSPAEGVVYFGQPQNGKWPDPGQFQNTLKAGGVIKPNQTIMTVVRLQPLKLVAAAPEADLQHIAPGTRGTAVPTAFPARKVDVSVEQVATVPLGEGRFLTTLVFDGQADLSRLVPGMTCKVHIKKKATPEKETE